MTSRTPKPWEHKNPVKSGAQQKLTPEQIEMARQRAEAAGRRYPNLIDNMFVAAEARRKQATRRTGK